MARFIQTLEQNGPHTLLTFGCAALLCKDTLLVPKVQFEMKKIGTIYLSAHRFAIPKLFTFVNIGLNPITHIDSRTLSLHVLTARRKRAGEMTKKNHNDFH
jgi:hypothetical protein